MFGKDDKKAATQSQEPVQETSALVKLERSYPALSGGGAVAEAIAVNLGNEELTVFDLERVRVPSGGGIAWEVPDANGEPQPMKTIEGIIVFTKMGRSFWEKSLDDSGGGLPPDCSSPDGVRGFGNPGGNCKTCPHAQWGSSDPDSEGRAQACKQQRFIFLLREGSSLPTVLVLPPTSLKAMKKWLLMISTRSREYFSFVTRFELVKTTNKGGINYAQVKPSIVRELTPEEIASVKAFAVKTADTFREYKEGAEEDAA